MIARLIAASVAALALGIAPAQAHHVAAGCGATAPILINESSHCEVLTTCGAPTACLFTGSGSVHGAGVLGLSIFVGGFHVGTCAPAVGGCSVSGPFNLPPIAGTGMLRCVATGTGVAVEWGCSGTPTGHI
jgi:hypothetical protein